MQLDIFNGCIYSVTKHKKERIMQRFSFLLTIVLFGLMLLIGACGGSDDNGDITEIPDINPDDFDWDVYIIDIPRMFRLLLDNADWLSGSTAMILIIGIQFDNADPVTLQQTGYFGDLSYGEARLYPDSPTVWLFRMGPRAAVALDAPSLLCHLPAFYNPPHNFAKLVSGSQQSIPIGRCFFL